MKKSKQMLTKAEVAKILGEILDTIPEENTTTREALKIAKCEISRRSGQHSKQHTGKAWTEYEDENLCKMFDDRCTVREICNFLGRPKGGCSTRLRRLGKIKKSEKISDFLEP